MLSTELKERLALALVDALNVAVELGPEHREVDLHLSSFQRELRRAFDTTGERRVELAMSSSLFMHSGAKLVSATIRGRRQIEALRGCSAGGFEFDLGTTEADLRRLIQFSVDARGSIQSLEDARTNLAARGVQSVRLLAADDDYEWAPVHKPATASLYERSGFRLADAAPVYRSMAMAVEDAVDVAQRGGAVNMSAARSVGEQLSAVTFSGYSDLLHLVERPDFDLFTIQHSLRVALLATYVASKLGAATNVLTEIAAAGLLHDVGKGRVPREILEKPGRLDAEEREAIARHPQLGAEILLESPEVGPSALGAAFGHHLRHDGGGYPGTRPWFKRSRITSLIQVCDVFEALTARRPYKEPYSPARAFEIMYDDAGAFDPQLLAAFTRQMGLYPPGRFVRLSDGRLARVAAVGAALDRPTVRTMPDGEVIDLGQPSDARLSVAELLDEHTALREVTAAERTAEDPERADTNERSDEPSQAPEVDHRCEPDGGLHGDGCRLC